MTRFTRLALLAAATAFMFAASPAMADEISDQIKEGLKLYDKGKISEAMSELEFAIAQMRQKKAASMGDVFPDAPSGWKAKKAKGEATGRSMLGGAVQSSRQYLEKSGKGSALVEVTTDSPFIQTLSMMLQNPMFMQSQPDSKLMKINGQKAILKVPTDDKAEIQCIIDSKIMLKVSVRKTDDAEDIAKKLAKGVNFKKLRELNK